MLQTVGNDEHSCVGGFRGVALGGQWLGEVTGKNMNAIIMCTALTLFTLLSSWGWKKMHSKTSKHTPIITINHSPSVQTDDTDALETPAASMTNEQLGERMLQMEALIKSQNDRIQELESRYGFEQDKTPAVRCKSVYGKGLLILVTSLIKLSTTQT